MSCTLFDSLQLMSKKEYKISVLSGDGIGPEVMAEALRVIDKISTRSDVEFVLDHQLVGGIAIDETSSPLPDETLRSCENSDAILFGSVGGPKWESLPPDSQPERGALLPLRKHFGLFANLRPSICFPSLTNASPIKPDLVDGGFDVLCVRELTGGIYFGEPKEIKEQGGEKVAIDTMVYKESEIERIAAVAFDAAMGRNKHVTSIDKANVLRNGILWRDTVEKVASKYPEVNLEHLYVDNAAMQLILNPSQFNIIVSENTFGDILTDEASVLSSSLGMLPSASLSFIPGEFNKDKKSLYEPIHGSAPDIAGKGIANPIGMILSTAMMFEYSFNEKEISELISDSVEKIINDGLRTKDISGSEKFCSTSEMGDAISEEILSRG